jgi:hypothetical protein
LQPIRHPHTCAVHLRLLSAFLQWMLWLWDTLGR